MYTNKGNRDWKIITIKQIVRAGEKYHLTWSKGFFTVNIVLNKVDVIDSE